MILRADLKVSVFLNGQDLEAGVEVEVDVQRVVGVLLLLEGLQVLGLAHPACQDALQPEHRRLSEFVGLAAVVVDFSKKKFGRISVLP